MFALSAPAGRGEGYNPTQAVFVMSRTDVVVVTVGSDDIRSGFGGDYRRLYVINITRYRLHYSDYIDRLHNIKY